jgi:hypothetical protein
MQAFAVGAIGALLKTTLPCPMGKEINTCEECEGPGWKYENFIVEGYELDTYTKVPSLYPF